MLMIDFVAMIKFKKFFLCIVLCLVSTLFLVSVENKVMSSMDNKKTTLNIKTPIPNTFGLQLFHGLVRRVWLTEFNHGNVTDIANIIYIDGFCEAIGSDSNNARFEPSGSSQNKSKDFIVWPYQCDPVLLDYSHVTKDTKGNTFVWVKMLDFPGADDVIPITFSLVKGNRLGKYAMSDQRYDEIRGHLQSNGRALYKSNSRILEKWNWEDIPENHMSSNIEYDTVMKNRVLLLSWDGEVYSRENGYVTYRVSVPENFFQPW